MDELEGFKKRIHSSIERALDGHVVLLPFLDEAEIALVKEETKYLPLNVKFSGKAINAIRQRCILSNYDINEEDFKIVSYKINYNNKFYEISHRNVLGALMSLGIKRECLGDILVKDNGIYIFVEKEISSFILNEFKSIGKCSIELKEINEEIENEIKYESKLYFLSSLRLDCVIASIYNLSRSNVLEILENKCVFLNAVLNQNPSHICKVLDVISVRHYGKFKILDIKGKSRSDRICVELGKQV